LFRRVIASKRVRVVCFAPSFVDGALQAAKQKSLFLIDATGRRCFTATKTVHPVKRWAARTFLAPRRSSEDDPELKIAALPEGFVYRLGSSRHVVLGFAGRNTAIAGTPSELEQRLLEEGSGWILNGLPRISELIPGKSSVASIQWSIDGVGLMVGDAALSRDSLSSQGVAAGISDALYCASALRNGDDLGLLRLRRVEQREAHLRSLQQTIQTCRFRNESTWKDYADFVALHLGSERIESKVALRSGRLTTAESQHAEIVLPS